LRHLRVGKAEAGVSMAFAQFFAGMGGQIDDRRCAPGRATRAASARTASGAWA
jgi:hypothetical protein